MKMSDRMVLRQAETLLEVLSQRLKAKGAQNILLPRLNPLKTIFLLTKMLHVVTSRFSFLSERSEKLKDRLT